MELSFFLFFGTIWTTARASDPDVFPSEFLVPQCTVLKAVWGQPVRQLRQSRAALC
jgi:hypothetical protein